MWVCVLENTKSCKTIRITASQPQLPRPDVSFRSFDECLFILSVCRWLGYLWINFKNILKGNCLLVLLACYQMYTKEVASHMTHPWLPYNPSMTPLMGHFVLSLSNQRSTTINRCFCAICKQILNIIKIWLRNSAVQFQLSFYFLPRKKLDSFSIVHKRRAFVTWYWLQINSTRSLRET